MVLRIRLARFGRRVSYVAIWLPWHCAGRWLRANDCARAAALPRSRTGRRSGHHACSAAARTPPTRPRAAPGPTKRAQNLPFYRLVVAEARTKRDGKHLEQVGWYDPHPGECLLAPSAGLICAPHGPAVGFRTVGRAGRAAAMTSAGARGDAVGKQRPGDC